MRIARITAGLILTLGASLQAQPEFEVATVKLSPPPEGNLININIGTVRNGKVTFSNASLSDCLKFAWGVVSDAQLAGPDWMKSKDVRFDIVAQTSPETPREQIQLMLQALLADRLKLRLHHEQKELAYLELVRGDNKPKLPPAKPAPAAGNISVAGHIARNEMTLPLLATLLSRFENNIFIDKTGLTGAFEIKLEWAHEPIGIQAAPEPPAGPSIYTAIREQLGLKLESRKGPLDVLVVDYAEKVPAGN